MKDLHKGILIGLILGIFVVPMIRGALSGAKRSAAD